MDAVNMLSKKNSYHHGNLRSELIYAAIELLDEQGVEAVSVRKIARKVGVAHSAPANHFKDKKALFTALATEIFTHLLSIMDKELKTKASSLSESIHLFSKTILEFGLKYPNRYHLLWRKECLNNEDEVLYAVMENMYERLTKILAEHQQQSASLIKSQASVESQAIALWSMIHGYVTLRLDGNLIAKNDEQSGLERQTAIIDVLLNGLM